MSMCLGILRSLLASVIGGIIRDMKWKKGLRGVEDAGTQLKVVE